MTNGMDQMLQATLVRRVGLRFFSRINPGDVTITHHWTGDRLRLHSFRHKGYWYHGFRRERSTMLSLVRLLGRGDVVIEAGGHIGYLTLHCARLVGEAGGVHVFEPGPNNLPYLHANVDSIDNVVIVEEAVGNTPGIAQLFVEDLTGQNNTMLADAGEYRRNSRSAGVDARTYSVSVPVTTMDDYCADNEITPTLLKIDVESFELEVLEGAKATLAGCQPIVLVEIARREDEVLALMTSLGYGLFSDDLRRLRTVSPGQNYVFLHEGFHEPLIDRVCQG
jgi:FkbM family methyltransferase